MKIIAESTPVSRLSYIHLGYLSASGMGHRGGGLMSLQGGGALLASLLAVAGITLMFRLLRETTAAGTTALKVRFRRSTVGFLGLLLLVASLALFLISHRSGVRYRSMEAAPLVDSVQLPTPSASVHPLPE
jgi:hypothetical protein